MANTCAPVGSEPVPKDTIRIVLEPSSVAGPNGSETTGGTVDLAGKWGAVYLRFGDGWKRQGTVVRAFLLLEPAEDAASESADSELHVWTIGAPWTASRIASGIRPSLGPPRARGLLRKRPRTTARIDVTDVVLALAEKPRDDGFAVLAESGANKAAVRTGSSGGAPKLELYVRARK